MGMTKEQKKRIDKITVKQIQNLYKQPISLKDIAKKLKVSVDFVMNFAKRNGIKRDNNITLKIRQKTNIKKYGYINPLQNKAIKEKSKATCLKKYGVDNPAKSKVFVEKARQTNLERYGTEWTQQNKKIQDKKKKTMIARYGYTTPAKNEKVKEKMFKTNIERYGVKYTGQLKETKEKKEQTNLKKYGSKNVWGNKQIREKSKDTILKKYGVDNVSKNRKIREKAEKTNIKRFGTKYPSQNEKIKNKVKKTNLDRYGCEYITQNEDFKNKIKQTNLQKYGKESYTQTEEFKDKTKATCQQKYNCDYPCQRPEARLKGNNSKPNKNFANLLNEYGIKYSREFNIGKYSYDFKIDNILVEVNPSFTHNATICYKNNKLLSKIYHQEKSRLAEQNGYHCIHIWDWDDEDKIIELFLKPKEKVYARNTEIKEIDKKIANEFLGQYHLQGACRENEINIGLYDKKNTLIQVMTFGKPRYNNNYEYELLRLCSSKQVVVGGNEKLFKYFLKTYKPKSIISYCDSSKLTGEVYKKLGFILKSDQPSKHWYNIKTKRHIINNKVNEELLKQQGFWEIYDAGQRIYIYNKKK